MKKYKEYMDGVKAPDTLHQRLLELETPAGRPALWKRYGAVAAALVLVVCLGAFGLGGGWDAIAGNFRPAVVMAPENVGVPDIAPEAPGDEMEPGEKTIGGYEVTVGSGSEAMVSYYVLPYIEYGMPKEQAQMSLDWDIPKGAIRGNLPQSAIIALMGGEDAVNTHLDWGGYELTGWAAWYEDGSFWGAYIQGNEGPLDHFEFAVTADQLPPTCIAYPESVTQEVRGLTVTADGHDSMATPQGGVDASSRRVSFMKDGYGYRFDITGTSRALTEERVSRLVCRIADKGLDESFFSGVTVIGNGTYTCDVCGNTFPVGTVHNDPDVCALPPYDPNGAADPSDNAPASSESPRDRGEDWCGTPGADPNDAMCSGYPVPDPGETHTCPICGEVFPINVEHSHLPPDPAESWEVCGLPLAPADTAP